MLIKAKNKVNGSITLVPEKFLEFNKNYKKATKADLKRQEKEQEQPDEEQNQETVATEENANG